MALLSDQSPPFEIPLPLQRRSTVAFTLVEMLVVLGIIGILAAVSLPAVVGMSKASRGNGAMGVMMSTVDQARNLAISKAATTYLVMATSDKTWPTQYRGRAYAIFTEEYIPATETYQKISTGRWETLPQGVCFKQDPATTVFGVLPFGQFLFPPAGQNLPVAVVKFTSTGAIESPDYQTQKDFAHIVLFEGFFDDNGTAVVTNPAGTKGEYDIKLALLTGRGLRGDSVPKDEL